MAVDKELLGAIKGILDESLQPINTRLDGIDSRLDGIEDRLTHVELEVRQINVTIENEIRPNIQKIAEGQTGLREIVIDVRDKVEELDTKVTAQDTVQGLIIRTMALNGMSIVGAEMDN